MHLCTFTRSLLLEGQGWAMSVNGHKAAVRGAASIRSVLEAKIGDVYEPQFHHRTWNMPYPPGLSGYLTERGTLFYNGRTSEESFLSRFPFKGGVVLEADWNGKVLWEVRHPDHHQHGILLHNGNVLLHCMAEVPDDIARRVTGGMVENIMQSGQYAPRPQAD